MSDRPDQPVSLAPEHLGFRMQPRMVPWLSPTLLMRTGLQLGMASMFGAYADKRELQEVTPAAPLPGWADRDELWLDYVADVGDAFGPTMSVASLLASPSLSVAGDGADHVTVRGNVLVFGGDEVYPTPTVDAYRDRTTGPYRAALPFTADDHPHLYAVPGNHDWYDGLTAFLRVFCAGAWIGGWRTHQDRSYFAVELPHRWHLWGIDIQLDTYIDGPQLRYFGRAAEGLAPGDAVILCSAVPSWVDANAGAPDAFANLDYLERTIIRPAGATVALALTGDAHHYARYATADGTSQRITAGGGGAYTSATHHLPDRLELPPRTATDLNRTQPPAELALQSTWPSAPESARRRWHAALLPLRNGSFWLLVGIVHLVLVWAVLAALQEEPDSLADALRALTFGDAVGGLASSPVALVGAITLGFGLSTFTKCHDRRLARTVGFVHAGAHLAAAVAWLALCASLADAYVAHDGLLVASTAVAVAVGGGLAGSWVMALYLVLADRALGLNANELFAAQRMRSHKHFLRLHIDVGGDLTVYPIGLRRTERSWSLTEVPDIDGPWLRPAHPLEPELVEAPIRVPGPRSRR